MAVDKSTGTQNRPKPTQGGEGVYPFLRVKPGKKTPEIIWHKRQDPTVRMMVELFMAAPTGWCGVRLYHAHRVKSALAAR